MALKIVRPAKLLATLRESIYRQKLAALEELKKALLHEEFRGRL